MQNPGKESQDEQFIRRLYDIIVEHFHNDQFNVEQLSSEIGLSRSQLYRRLKQLKGLTISQFVRQVRLEEAKKLLLDNAAGISEVAYQVGFNSPAYFHKCFHDYFGLTPGEMIRLSEVNREILAEQPVFSSQSGGGDQNDGEDRDTGKHKVRSNSPPSALNENWLRATLFSLVIILAISFFFELWQSAPKDHHTIAILPLTYLPKSPEKDFWAISLQEALRSELDQTPAIRMLSNASTMGISERNMLLPEIARELEVDAIVEGTLLEIADSVWVRINLIATHPEEKPLWSGEYKRSVDQWPAAQDTLIVKLGQEISNTLSALHAPE